MKEITNAQIHKVLNELGVNPANYGYVYLTDAIRLVYDDPFMLNGITKRLYPMVASMNSSTPFRVERAIRHSIERVFNCTDIETLLKYFGGTISKRSGKVTNSTFIACVVNNLKDREDLV